MDEKFLKPYDPKATEGRIYKEWEESRYFNPDNLPGERSEQFSVVLPPVNVTGVLHVGHAYEDSLQDAAVRFERMRGKKVLFVPGTDSAAIATQARVEKKIMKEEGKSRHDLGREELVRRVTEYAKSSEETILNQVRRMGVSLDWSRYAYTLDEKRNRAVTEAFIRMYEAGLIYRGNRVVNWDPKGQTTISDDEIAHEERDATLHTFRYSKDFPIPIATTRLETKVGDVAVAVHPDDARYKQYVGKEYDTVFCDVPIHIKVIADSAAEPEFGTGALGVTPAHSMIDWEMAERHGLPRDKQVINEYAKMTVDGRLNGLKTVEAREKVAEWLRSEGLMEKEEVIKQNVSTAERTGAIIEPLPKLQWWIDVDKPFAIPHSEIPGIESGSQTTLKDIMRIAVESRAVEMTQEGFRSAYFHWIDNLRDWCISRQIWFGHRIPIWYKGDDVKAQLQSPGDDWTQDPDVLDTWFSSALWTFSTLGWPSCAETATKGKPGPENDFANYLPTSFMCPGYEILFLWVSRMILMSGFHLGQVPFKTVMMHGLVRAKDGRKFSKSLNNGVDPLDIIDMYGADALRMGLIIGTPIGSDVRFDEQKIKAYKLFANKLWNIARFILENTKELELVVRDENIFIRDVDEIHWSKLAEVAKDVTEDFENYRYYLAGEKLYHYVWHTFADEILEKCKVILRGDDVEAKKRVQHNLYSVLYGCLKLLHPFMPFITEEIWKSMPARDSEMLMIAKWPI